jgi:prepilin-type N-terminal cleavage/methylation domain-containing protein
VWSGDEVIVDRVFHTHTNTLQEKTMMLRKSTDVGRAVRQAFTMIELLVVIAIISILITLITVGVMRAKVTATNTQIVSEMALLSNAIAAFKNDRRVQYIPSHFDPTLPASQIYIRQAWPQITTAEINNIPVLEGDQCLVFFLGGFNGTNGISKNPQTPFSSAIGDQNSQSYFQFPANRLVLVPGNITTLGINTFPSFNDPFGAPYAYFNYNNFGNGKKNQYTADCSTIAGSFLPYQDSSTTFFQPTGFQIISAGKDEAFGVGSSTGLILQAGIYDAQSNNNSQYDADNLTSFYRGVLSGYSPTN